MSRERSAAIPRILGSMLLEKVAEANSMVQEKYVTISAYKKSIEEARTYFARVGSDLVGNFMRLGSKCVEMDATDKLRALHDFYRTGEETDFRFDLSETMRKGHSFKDFICPDTFEFDHQLAEAAERKQQLFRSPYTGAYGGHQGTA